MTALYARSGDLIGFSGNGRTSVAINLLTFGIPYWSLSHVAIMGYSGCGRKLLFESTDAGEPCEITGRPVLGVQAHRLKDSVESYNGKVWRYPLYRPLYVHENARLTSFLMKQVGHPYDEVGAKMSAGLLFASVCSLIHPQDLGEEFCSELASAAEANIGIFQTTNAGRWNPNSLVRTMRRAGVLGKPIRLK
jgi:hypothetical protein